MSGQLRMLLQLGHLPASVSLLILPPRPRMANELGTLRNEGIFDLTVVTSEPALANMGRADKGWK